MSYIEVTTNKTSEQYNVEYWNNFYKKVRIQDQSTFCEYVKKNIDCSNYIVIDIGCGSGRDTLSFAREGISVVGVDRSLEAIHGNNLLRHTLSESNIFEFIVSDIGDNEQVSSLMESVTHRAVSENKKILVYIRFVLHSINEETQQILLSTLSEYLKPGDIVAAEFRTIEDESRNKIYDNHYRRFIDSDLLIADLENSYHYKTLDFFKGTGLSIFNGEDPYLARFIVEKF